MVKSWYAISVHSRKERSAERGLVDKGFEVFLPIRTERRIWSDRIKSLRVALFPGYVFVRTSLNAKKRIDILGVPQVWDLVGRIPDDPRIARSIPDHQIESLKKILDAQRDLDPTTGLIEGTEVLVGQGPLKGARGLVLQAPDGKRKLVVQIELLGRGVRTTLDAGDVLASQDHG